MLDDQYDPQKVTKVMVIGSGIFLLMLLLLPIQLILVPSQLQDQLESSTLIYAIIHALMMTIHFGCYFLGFLFIKQGKTSLGKNIVLRYSIPSCFLVGISFLALLVNQLNGSWFESFEMGAIWVSSVILSIAAAFLFLISSFFLAPYHYIKSTKRI